MEITVGARARSGTGKGPARRARAAGQVPAVLYGRGLDPVPLAVEVREMSHALHTESGANVLINLRVDARTYLTMVKEVHRHPVRGTLLHVDFVSVARDVAVEAAIPVHIVGESHGVKEGGVIEHHLWEIDVRALPTDLPPAIEVDVTPLGIGEHLRVADVVPPPGVEILSPSEEIVVSVVTPQVLRVEEEEVAAPAEAEEARPAEGEES